MGNVFKAVNTAQTAPFGKRLASWSAAMKRNTDYKFDNDHDVVWSNSAGTGSVEGVRVGSDDKVWLNGQRFTGSLAVKTFTIQANAKLADQVFFIADRAYTVKAIYEVHSTAGSDSSAVTATIRKSADGVTVANGTALCSAINMKATANTVQTATLSTAVNSNGTSVLELAENDRISIDFSGTLTALVGVQVTLVLAPGHASETAVYSVVANGDLADRCFYVANRPMKITSIKYAHATAGTDASAVVVQVTKDTSTDAPGAGTDLLTNNSNAGFNCKGTINTVQEGSLSATAANLQLATGDRLSVDFAGTLTALAGVVVVVEMEPLQEYKDVQFFAPVDGTALADTAFFIADRDYEIVRAQAVWATASSGATNVQLVTDTLTDAPGAGTDLLSNDSSAGFQTDGTANTPEQATWVNVGRNFLRAGNRLSLDFSGTLTALVGVVVNVTLRPV